MRHVGDVNLQVPAAIRAMLDEYRVIEVARRLSVDGDDRQVAEILAAGALRFADRFRATFRFLQNFSREGMRKVMLADDDLGVDAQAARAAKVFVDPAGRVCPS